MQTLYGYGGTNPYDIYGYGQFGAGPFNTPFSAGGMGGMAGYQAATGTTNPYNPTCPWGLINQMIQQIAEYVSQLQQSQGAIGPNTAQGFGLTNYATSPFTAGRGGPFGFAAGEAGAMGGSAFRPAMGRGPAPGVGGAAGAPMK